MTDLRHRVARMLDPTPFRLGDAPGVEPWKAKVLARADRIIAMVREDDADRNTNAGG